MSTPPSPSPRPRAVTPLQRGMVAVLGILVLLALCLFHYRHSGVRSALTPDGMDMVQAARRVGGGGGLSTNVVRPLLLRYVRVNDDGSLPNMAHAPLYPILAGIGMQMTGRGGPGQGEKIAILLSLVFFVVSLVACYRLALRLFGPTGAFLSCLLYALAANALTYAVDPRPFTLATTLFILLLLALVSLDVAGTDERIGIGRVLWAGALFGFLFLSLYSSLILLLPILVYVYLVTRRNLRMTAAFLAAAVLIAAPLLLRNVRVSGNPVFNARLLELVMQTPRYPGYTLYRSVGMDQALPEYLASGGLGEILSKVGGNLLGYYSQIPYAFGILLLPLFLVASLTRFTNPQVNRLRFLVYVLLGLHILGLSLFLPFSEGLPILLIYLPFAAVIGTTFFLNFLRARNLPPFYARAAVTAWIVIACVPGVTQLLTVKTPAGEPYRVYSELNRIAPNLQTQRAVVASDAPWEVAYRVGLPTVWLPNNSTEYRATEEHLRRPISLLVLTPLLEQAYATDLRAAPWRNSYIRLTSLLTTANFLPREVGMEMLRNAPMVWPPEIGPVLVTLGQPQLVPEAGGARYSFLWRNPATAQQQK